MEFRLPDFEFLDLRSLLRDGRFTRDFMVNYCFLALNRRPLPAFSWQ